MTIRGRDGNTGQGGSSSPLSASRTGSSGGELDVNSGGDAANIWHRPTERPIHPQNGFACAPDRPYQMIDAGTLYLIIGGALIFGACAYAAKRILRQLTLKQVGIIGIITVVTIAAIWGFLALSLRKHEPGREFNQPTPSLQSSPD